MLSVIQVTLLLFKYTTLLSWKRFMHLVKPDIQFEKSFREGLGELGSELERREWIYLSHEAYSDF